MLNETKLLKIFTLQHQLLAVTSSNEKFNQMSTDTRNKKNVAHTQTQTENRKISKLRLMLSSTLIDNENEDEMSWIPRVTAIIINSNFVDRVVSTCVIIIFGFRLLHCEASLHFPFRCAFTIIFLCFFFSPLFLFCFIIFFALVFDFCCFFEASSAWNFK